MHIWYTLAEGQRDISSCNNGRTVNLSPFRFSRDGPGRRPVARCDAQKVRVPTDRRLRREPVRLHQFGPVLERDERRGRDEYLRGTSRPQNEHWLSKDYTYTINVT